MFVFLKNFKSADKPENRLIIAIALKCWCTIRPMILTVYGDLRCVWKGRWMVETTWSKPDFRFKISFPVGLIQHFHSSNWSEAAVKQQVILKVFGSAYRLSKCASQHMLVWLLFTFFFFEKKATTNRQSVHSIDRDRGCVYEMIIIYTTTY